MDFHGISLGAHKTKVKNYSQYENTGYRNWGKPEEGYTYRVNFHDSDYFLALDNEIEGIAISRRVDGATFERMVEELTQKWGEPTVDNRITQDEMLYQLYLRWHLYYADDDNDLMTTIVVRTKRLAEYEKASEDAYDFLF